MYVHNRFPSCSLSHNAVGMFWIIEPGELLSPHFKRHGNKGWMLNVCNLWRRPLHGGSKSPSLMCLSCTLMSAAVGSSLSCTGQWDSPMERKAGGTSRHRVRLFQAALENHRRRPRRRRRSYKQCLLALKLAWCCYGFVRVGWDLLLSHDILKNRGKSVFSFYFIQFG